MKFYEFFERTGSYKGQNRPTSDVDKIFSKMYSQYVLFRNKYKFQKFQISKFQKFQKKFKISIRFQYFQKIKKFQFS
jgi:hypothetical protein